MFVKELGKKAGVPSVYTLPFYMLGNGKVMDKKLKVSNELKTRASGELSSQFVRQNLTSCSTDWA